MNAAAVRPYMMDLGSTNGTFLNNERLDPSRYYELLEQVLTCKLWKVSCPGHTATGCAWTVMPARSQPDAAGSCMQH